MLRLTLADVRCTKIGAFHVFVLGRAGLQERIGTGFWTAGFFMLQINCSEYLINFAEVVESFMIYELPKKDQKRSYPSTQINHKKIAILTN